MIYKVHSILSDLPKVPTLESQGPVCASPTINVEHNILGCTATLFPKWKFRNPSTASVLISIQASILDSSSILSSRSTQPPAIGFLLKETQPPAICGFVDP